jgi:hypothetical protein
MSETTWSLVLSFPEQDPRFTYGFEAGMLWQRLVDREVVIHATAHSFNHGLIHRMAQHHGYTLAVEATDYDEWIMVTMTLPGVEPAPEENEI